VVKRAASLVQAWTEDLRGRIPDPHLAAEDVRVGVFYTAVQLSTGHVGVACLRRAGRPRPERSGASAG
jgi:hypothetical protein